MLTLLLVCSFSPRVQVSRGVPDNCTFEITLLQAIMLTLLLVCAFFSTQVQKYLAWVCNMVPFRAIATLRSQ